MGAMNEPVKIIQTAFNLQIILFQDQAVFFGPVSKPIKVADAGVYKSNVSIMLEFFFHHPESSFNTVLWSIIIIDYAQWVFLGSYPPRRQIVGARPGCKDFTIGFQRSKEQSDTIVTSRDH